MRYLCFLAVVAAACLTAWAHNPSHPRYPIKAVLDPGYVGADGSCQAPSQQIKHCLRQWACQHLINLDLRCLLNLNGNPLLSSGGGAGGGGGLLGGGAGGLLGGILGGKK